MSSYSPSQMFSEQVVSVSRLVDAWKADAPSQESLSALRQAAFALACDLGTFEGLAHSDSSVSAALGLALQLQESGAMDYPAPPAAVEFTRSQACEGWRGLVASMLACAPWQWVRAPRIDSIPTWLWTPYAQVALTPPQGFCAPGQAEKYAFFVTDLLEQFCRQAQANRGAAAVKGLLNAVVEKLNCIPLYFNPGSMKPLYEARGRLLSIALGVPKQETLIPFPREGRRLRIGFLNRHFGPQTETYTTLPTFEHLDPDRFEVFLFSCYQTGEALEKYVASLPWTSVRLPGDLEGQLSTLRTYALDVLVFGTNTTATLNEVTRLALYRSATLQVVNNSSCTTSGLPEIDLYVSGALTEPQGAEGAYTERLALLPGAAHAFNYHADAQEPTVAPTRAALGIPDDAFLFVSGANYHKIVPEMMESWASILSSVPGSYLLVHPFNPNWSAEYPMKRFCALFDEVLARHGVDGCRLVISANRFPSRTDVVQLLALGNMYLDTYPFGGVNSVIDALEQGMPVLEWQGSCFRSRMGAALLRELGVEDCIAGSAEEYRSLAVRLATDNQLRGNVRERIIAGMTTGPRFLDVVAASEDFGVLMEQAYDILASCGDITAFRSARSPLQLAEPAPCGSTAHTETARRLLSQGLPERALEHLMAAIESSEAGGDVWFLLAETLRGCGREPAAIKALETALRLSPQNVEGWLMLVEIAEGLGATDMASESAAILYQLAPSDPRVGALQTKYPAPEKSGQ